MYDIKVFASDILISRYCNMILYPISNKIFDIESIYNVKGLSKLNIVHDIKGFSDAISNVQGLSFWSVLNIVPGLVYYIDAYLLPS
jgi:hypothetical protein